MAHPLDSARPQRKSQMQKAQEQQLFVLPPGEEIPGDEGFRFGPQFFAEAGKNALGSGVVGSDLPDGVEGGRLPLRRPDGKRDLVLEKALEHAAEKALKAAVVQVDHI